MRRAEFHPDSQLQVWSAWKIMKNRVVSTWFEIQAKSSLLGEEKLQGEHELSFRTSRRRFPRKENDDESPIAAYKLQLTPPAGTEGFSSKLFNPASSSLGRFWRMNPCRKAWNPSKTTAPFLCPCRQGERKIAPFLRRVLTLSAQFPRIRTCSSQINLYRGEIAVEIFSDLQAKLHRLQSLPFKWHIYLSALVNLNATL